MAYEDIIASLTLEEKCALLSGATAFGAQSYPSKGVPELHFSDGPHGLRVQGEGANHLGIGGSLPATCFPTAVTVSNTWEPELAEQIGVALAEESAAIYSIVVTAKLNGLKQRAYLEWVISEMPNGARLAEQGRIDR